jgi:hypothetical protein
MATWQWADLSSASKPHAPLAGGDPFAYGVVECEEGSVTDFDTGGCSILIPRIVFRGVPDHTTPAGKVYELNLDGLWYCNDLFAASSVTGTSIYDDPTGYATGNTNGVATVNYVNLGSINQLSLSPNGWIQSDISPSNYLTTGFSALNHAFGYWDSYGNVNRVIYRSDSSNGHQIIELSKASGQPSWFAANLSTNVKNAPPAPPAALDPMGYCSGVPRVVYLGTDGHIYELHLEPVGWKWADLTKICGAPPAAGAPYGYAADIARVIYTDTSAQIIELALHPSGWKCENLSTNDKPRPAAPPAAGNPFGYTTFDGSKRVVYRGTNGHIYELHSDKSTNFFWRCNDLSMIAKATSSTQVAAGDPCGYEAGDSIPRVAYRGTNGHICELALR